MILFKPMSSGFHSDIINALMVDDKLTYSMCTLHIIYQLSLKQ